MENIFKLTFDDNDHAYIGGNSLEELKEKWLNKSVPKYTDRGIVYKKIINITFHQLI